MGKITKIEYSSAFRSAVYAVASSIAPDLEQACADCGEPLDNEGLIEACLDADRLSPKAGLGGTQASYDEYKELLKKHDFTKLVKAVSRDLRLI